MALTLREQYENELIELLKKYEKKGLSPSEQARTTLFQMAAMCKDLEFFLEQCKEVWLEYKKVEEQMKDTN